MKSEKSADFSPVIRQVYNKKECHPLEELFKIFFARKADLSKGKRSKIEEGLF
jgi:hypothetical protein